MAEEITGFLPDNANCVGWDFASGTDLKAYVNGRELGCLQTIEYSFTRDASLINPRPVLSGSLLLVGAPAELETLLYSSFWNGLSITLTVTIATTNTALRPLDGVLTPIDHWQVFLSSMSSKSACDDLVHETKYSFSS